MDTSQLPADMYRRSSPQEMDDTDSLADLTQLPEDMNDLDAEYIPDDTEFAPFERENSFAYRPGGFHPVTLNAPLDPSGRFHVLHKLGHGGFATVWLARDTQRAAFAAVKILSAATSTPDCPELRWTRELGGHPNVVLPREHFWLDGPNGRHLALVLPLLGGGVGAAWAWRGGEVGWRRRVGRQVVEAVAFLHRKGVCHGDLRPANVLVKTKGLDGMSEAELMALLGEPRTEPFPDNEGMLRGESTPEVLVADTSLDVLGAAYLSDDIALVDFGVAFPVASPPQFPSIPQAYVPPEVVFGLTPPGIAADLWALGCTLYEMAVHAPAFGFDWGVEGWAADVEDMMGALPAPIREKWVELGYAVVGDGHPLVEGETMSMLSLTPAALAERREGWREDYGTEDMLLGRLMLENKFYRKLAGESADVHAADEDAGEDDLEFDGPPKGYEHVVFEIPADEAGELRDLLLKLWKYAPQDRPSAESLLSHRWFAGDTTGSVGTAGAVGEAVPKAIGWALRQVWSFAPVTALAQLLCPATSSAQRRRQ